MRRDKHHILAVAVICLTLALTLAACGRREIVGGNVWALGVSLAGLTPEDARQSVAARVDEIEQSPVVFVAGDRSVEVPQEDLKLVLDETAVFSEILKHVASKFLLTPASFLTKGDKQVLAARAEPQSANLDQVLERVASELSKPATAARYGFDGRDLVIFPPEAGQTVTADDVRAAFQAVHGSEVQVPYTAVPAIGGDALPELTLLAEFSTPYDITDTDRNVNLELASQAVHGEVIMPGKTYSFNADAGERTEAKGYRWANVVVGDHLEPGLAGGICQITTTLFNAAGQAGLIFPEIHAHGIPVPYVPPGLDAAVAWNYLDLKIRNNTDLPIVFGSWVEDGQVTARVFGGTLDSAFHLEPKIVAEYPAEGKNPGLLVETYRVEKRDGVEVKRTLVVRSVYEPSYPSPK